LYSFPVTVCAAYADVSIKNVLDILHSE
jgi:hypothetical protein